MDADTEVNRYVSTEKIFVLGRCVLCRESSVHRPDGTLLWPRESDVVSANMDMPEAIRDHYNEARLIAAQSPRSALTLLRYCVEKLLRDNGYGKGVNPTLYDRINDLYGSTGSRRLKRALDAVRNAGNSAAHEEDIEWYQQNANVVFTLVNLVVDELYSKDDEIEKVLDAQNSSQ